MFKDRYCAFIDILGFSNRILDLEKNWDNLTYERLRSCLNFMSEERNTSNLDPDLPIYTKNDNIFTDKDLGYPQITYISDCLIISTERNADGLKSICQKVTKIWTDLLCDGYLCRGAISGGPLIHDQDIIAGSAYMNAYELESTADVPRIIFDKNLSEIYDSFPSVFPAHPPTMDMAEDGFLYLRYFPFQFFPNYIHNWSDYMLRAREVICSGVNHKNAKVAQKYHHTKNEFNFCVGTYRRFFEDLVIPI